MIRKGYEIKGMDKCILSTTYRGVRVHLEFKGGDVSSKKNGTLATSDPFVQDAIEAMPALRKKIICTHAYTPARQAVPVVEEKKKPRIVAAKGVADRVSKVRKVASDIVDSVVIEEVKNINDAASYFMEKGEAVESKEQLEELMQKYNVVFPNMK